MKSDNAKNARKYLQEIRSEKFLSNYEQGKKPTYKMLNGMRVKRGFSIRLPYDLDILISKHCKEYRYSRSQLFIEAIEQYFNSINKITTNEKLTNLIHDIETKGSKTYDSIGKTIQIFKENEPSIEVMKLIMQDIQHRVLIDFLIIERELTRMFFKLNN